jgi:hypothetical protein
MTKKQPMNRMVQSIASAVFTTGLMLAVLHEN